MTHKQACNSVDINIIVVQMLPDCSLYVCTCIVWRARPSSLLARAKAEKKRRVYLARLVHGWGVLSCDQVRVNLYSLFMMMWVYNMYLEYTVQH